MSVSFPWRALFLSVLVSAVASRSAAAAGIVEWTHSFEAQPTRPVVLSEGRIVVGLRFDQRAIQGPEAPSVFLLSSSGETVWNFTTQIGVSAAPVVGPDDRIYFSHLVISPQGKVIDQLECLRPDGTRLWSRTLPYESGDEMAVGGDGTLVIPTRTAPALMAFFPSGEPMWLNTQFQPLPRHPSIGERGEIYCSSPVGFVIVGANGRSGFNVTNGFPFAPSAIDGSGHAWAVNQFGRIVGATPSGAVLASWPISLGVPPLQVPPVSSTLSAQEPVVGEDGSLFLVAARQSDMSRIVSYTQTGLLRWALNVSNQVIAPPAVARGGTLFVAREDQILEISDAGQWVRTIDVGHPLRMAPMMTRSGQLLVVGANQVSSLRPGFEFPTNSSWPMYRGDPAGSSARSSLGGLPPIPAVTNVALLVQRNRLQWSLEERPSGYSIWRSIHGATNSDPWLLGVNSSALGQFDDTNAVPGVVYDYWIEARREGVEGVSVSATVSATTSPARKLWTYRSSRLWGSPSIGPEGNVYQSETLAGHRVLTTMKPNGEILWQLPNYGKPMISPRGTLYLFGSSSFQELTAKGEVLRTLEFGDTAVGAMALSPNGSLWFILGISILNLNPDFTTNWLSSSSSFPIFTFLAVSPTGSGLLSRGTDLLRVPSGGDPIQSQLSGVSLMAPITVMLDDRSIVGVLNANSVHDYLAVDGAGNSSRLFSNSGNTAQVALSDGDLNVYAVIQSSQSVPRTGGGLRYPRDLVKRGPDGSIIWKASIGESAVPAALTSEGGAVLTQIGRATVLRGDGSIAWFYESAQCDNAVLTTAGYLYIHGTSEMVALESDVRLADAGWVSVGGDSRATSSPRRAIPGKLSASLETEGLNTRVKLEVQSGAQEPTVLQWSDDLKLWKQFEGGWFTNGFEKWVLPLDGSTRSRFFRGIAP